jgi:hypothetical protein
MTALRNDKHQSKKTLHKRSHPHMTAASAGISDAQKREIVDGIRLQKY